VACVSGRAGLSHRCGIASHGVRAGSHPRHSLTDLRDFVGKGIEAHVSPYTAHKKVLTVIQFANLSKSMGINKIMMLPATNMRLEMEGAVPEPPECSKIDLTPGLLKFRILYAKIYKSFMHYIY
jgi:hypothetical protein